MYRLKYVKISGEKNTKNSFNVYCLIEKNLTQFYLVRYS